MNRLTIIGNLTADPQSHVAPNGKEVCNFTVAVNRRNRNRDAQNGQPDADFFRVAAWDQRGKSCQQYLSKGKKVCVVGPVSVSTYTAQDGTYRANMEVTANEVEFLGGGNGNTQENTAPAAANEQGGFTAVETDELPF